MQKVSGVVAFLAGITSFLSPCVLPLVPAYISYIVGSSTEDDKLLVLKRSLGFVLGFSIIFIIMGASASYIGRLLARYKLLFTRLSGILIIIFGLHMTGILKFKLLYKQFRFKEPIRVNNYWGSILIGMAFAAGWTPCVGTVLGSILLYTSSVATMKVGILLLALYSLGLGLPFILTAFFIKEFMSILNKINKYTPIISKISGVIMIVFGILLYLNKIQELSQIFY